MGVGRMWLPRGVRKSVLAGLTVVIWLVAAVIWQGTAFGNNWGSNIDAACNEEDTSQCVAKNGFVDYWFVSFGVANFETWASQVWTSQYTNHGENDGSVTVTAASSQGGADAILYDNLVSSSGYHAWTWCPDSSEKVLVGPKKRYCEPQKITFNTKYDHFFDEQNEAKAYACHEMGHVFGLRHRSSDYCMNSSPGTKKQLGDHDMHCLKKYYDGLTVITELPAAQNCS